MTDLLKFYIEDIILKEEVLKSKFLKKRNSRQGNEIYLFDYYNSPFSKVGINNGAKNNRAMYNFPHAKFIEILKYKALLKDIVVIEIEESYTSKTSFIDNE